MKTRVVAAVVVLAAASVARCSSGPAQGAEGGACFPNGTCNAGLTCLSNLCVAANVDSGVGDAGKDANAQETSTQDSPADSPADVVTNDAPSFDPSQLSGLSIWLRSDKGVTTDTMGVATWTDQSPNHNDFAAGATHCSLVSSGINSLPIVDCTAVGAQVAGHATSIGTGPFTIEIVADSIVNNAAVFTTEQANIFDLASSNTKMVGGVGVGINPQASVAGTKVVTGGAAHILGFVRDASGNIALRTDGAADGSSASNGAVDLSNFPNSSLENARFAELVLVAGTLSAQQTSDLEAYLKARYGL